MGRASERYRPRHAEASVLYGVIRDHLDDFLGAATDWADGPGRLLVKILLRYPRGVWGALVRSALPGKRCLMGRQLLNFKALAGSGS